MKVEFSNLAELADRHFPRAEYPVEFTRKELGWLGKAPIATGNWGKKITARQYLDAHPVDTEEKRKEQVEMIVNSGFRAGYHDGPLIDPLSPEAQVRQAFYGAMLVEEVMRAREWNGIDRLTVGSASTLPQAAFLIPIILAKRGLTVEQTQFCGLACASVGAELGLNLSDPDMKGLRGVSLGVETLSGKYINDRNMEWIFGNGGAAIGYIPGQDFTHIYGKMKIIPDTKGVIRIPTAYELPPEEDRVPLDKLPKWAGIGWDEKFNGIINDYFAVDKHGNIYLLMPKSKDEFSRMSGGGTYSLFVRNTPPFALEVIEESGENIDLICAHQASGGVNDAIYNKILKVKPNINMRWVMDAIGVCNVSAATFLFALKKMAETDIEIGKPFAMLVMGIGACLREDIVVVN